MIVGRDPEQLDKAGIARAALESLAENTSDGVIAPLLAEKPAALFIANRSADKAVKLAEVFSDIALVNGGSFDDLVGKSFDLLINATSASLAGASLPMPPGIFAPGALAVAHTMRTLPTQKTAQRPVQQSCTECHGGSATADNKCVTCHQTAQFTPTISTAHLRAGLTCNSCHTEHRGILAQITEQTRSNPHGAFVFRAAGANSCTACHEFGERVATKPTLRDEPIVRRLYEKGRGAHRPGHIRDCLSCHDGGGQ